MTARGLLLVLIVSCPLSARAFHRPLDEPDPPEVLRERAWVVVSGAARVVAPQVRVRCTGVDAGLLLRKASCRVAVSLIVRARTDVVLTPGKHTEGSVRATEVRVDGDPLGDGRRVAAGSAATVETHAELGLSSETRYTGGYRQGLGSQRPNVSRHPLLGESEHVERTAHRIGVVIAGYDVEIDAAEAVQHVSPDHVHLDVVPEAAAAHPAFPDVRVDEHGDPGVAWLAFRVRLTTLRYEGNGVQHGGPVLSLGVRVDRATGHERFLLRAGYELAMFEYLFASLRFETDFDSYYESLLLSVASPVALLILGASAGVGVVARQRPEPGGPAASAALRLHLGATMIGPIGITADFDYWAQTRSWSAIVALRGGV